MGFKSWSGSRCGLVSCWARVRAFRSIFLSLSLLFRLTRNWRSIAWMALDGMHGRAHAHNTHIHSTHTRTNVRTHRRSPSRCCTWRAGSLLSPILDGLENKNCPRRRRIRTHAFNRAGGEEWRWGRGETQSPRRSPGFLRGRRNWGAWQEIASVIN